MKNDKLFDKVESTAINRNLLQCKLEQAIATWRWQLSLLVQVFTVLVVAHITFIGYAFTSKNAFLLAIGGLFPLVFFVILRTANRLAVPIVYTAVAVENEFAENGIDGLMTTTIGMLVSEEQIHIFRAICLESQFSKRMKALRNIKFTFLGNYMRLIEYILIANSIGQTVLASILMLKFQWKHFF